MAYIFIIVLLVMQAMILAGHWFLYESFLYFFPLVNISFIASLRIILFVASISFILASLLVFRFDNLFVRIFYTASVSWMGVFYFLFLASVGARLSSVIIKFFNFSIDLKTMAVSWLVLALALTVYSFINGNIVRVTRINVELPNLPEEWKGKTAVWTSDLHLGAVRNVAFAKSVAEKIKGLKPDMVFIGGDLYDGAGGNLDNLVAPFSNLAAPDGVYFITGNHEEFSDKIPYLEAVKRAGIKVLNNEMININGLQLIGVDYNDTRDKNKYADILKQFKINREQPSILLRHSPYYLDVAEKEGISFQISGHTHHGQIFPAGLLTDLIFHGFAYGFKNFGKLQVYASSGTGSWAIPMRLGSIPEIVLIEFK